MSQITVNKIQGLTTGGNANTIVLNTSSTDVLTVNSSGNVGIGTTTPSVELDIQTTTAGTKFQIQNTGSGGVNSDFIDNIAQSRIRHVGTILDLGADHNNLGTSDPRVKFRVGNTPQASITGHGGIAFGSDTAAANTLDDYEEGTWTPSLEFGGSATGITYGTQSGGYTKVGRLVYINGVIILTSKGTSTGNVSLRGFPFTVADILISTSNAGALSVHYFSSYTSGFVQTYPIENNTISGAWVGDSGHGKIFDNTDFANNTSLRFSGVYQAT